MSDIALEIWQKVASFLNSNFTAALAGALGGALAAQRIGDRSKQRDALLHEIRSTNAAIMVTFTICNSGIVFKKQHVKDIYETYTSKKAEQMEFQRRCAASQRSPDAFFEFQADFRALQMSVVPIDVLRTLVFEKISATGRPLALVATLVGVVASLENTINKRNALIERFQGSGPEGETQLPAFYFGLPYGPGHVSTEFPDTIKALYSQTDDVIFFSELLGKDLMTHGNRILDQYRKIAKVKEEKISSADFTEARNLGIMPDDANYTDWLRGFSSVAQQGVQPEEKAIKGSALD